MFVWISRVADSVPKIEQVEDVKLCLLMQCDLNRVCVRAGEMSAREMNIKINNVKTYNAVKSGKREEERREEKERRLRKRVDRKEREKS